MHVMVTTPDVHGAGLTTEPLDALRYDGHSDDPHEVGGMFRALMPENAKVLDVGCGTGSVTLIANAGKYNEVRAIEPDPQRAGVAASRGVDVHVGLLDQEYIAAHGPFDVIMSSDVLEHMAAPAEALRLFMQALRPGGHVLVSVPNVAHWTVRMSLLFGRFDYEPVGIMDATHLRWFTAKSITNLFSDAGFEVVSLQHTAGTFLDAYHRRPFRRFSASAKADVVRRLTRRMPLLFGCQHIVKARKPALST